MSPQRDAQGTTSSSPSSTETAKNGSDKVASKAGSAPATALPHIPVPQLLQNHETVDDPDTPPMSAGHDGTEEREAPLDLEELGLIDKEIPLAKIQKGDKIGSGGYKE